MNANGDAMRAEERAPWDPRRLRALNEAFREQPPQALLRWALARFGDGAVLGTGFGVSGVVLMHMVAQIWPQTTVFYLDTDLLFSETYALRDRLSEQLGIQFTRAPASLTLDEQAARHGSELWLRDPDACCYLRKVLPLRRFLADRAAWITGVRRDQSPGRADTQLLEWSQSNGVLKLNPLAFWSEEAVWAYVSEHELPSNPLRRQGYTSIGCRPCTRPVQPGEEARAGRWSGREKVECGIHIEDGQVRRPSPLL